MYEQAGFNQFLRRDLSQVSLSENKGLNDSELGAKESMSVGELMEKIATIPASLITGDLSVRTITAILGTIGGWTISNSTLTSGNVTIDSTNKRILISDGTNNRVLIGFQSGGF